MVVTVAILLRRIILNNFTLEDYIRYNYFYILNEGIIILAGLVGLIHLKKFKNTNVKYFIYFLVYVVFVEILGYYRRWYLTYDSLNWLKEILEGTIFEKNHLWYGLFWEVASALFLTFYFYSNLENKLYKNILKYSLITYVILTLICFALNYEIYYNDQVKSIWFLSVVQIIICTGCYFLEVLTSDKIMLFYKSINFYIAAVFFIWFLIKTPLIFYQVYYSKSDWSFVFLKRDIILFANVLMYSTFILALIFCKPENQKSVR